MKIVVLGANGMFGSMMVFYAKKMGKEVIPVTRNEFNVLFDPIQELEKYMDKNTVVINCIGAIPQKKYTDEEYNILNRIFPWELATLCKKCGVKLIHISTNCVFSGKNNNCKELDECDASDIYGYTKAQGEPLDHGIVIRSSIIGLEKETSFGLLEWFLNNSMDFVNGYVDSFWNGLTTLELAKVVLEVAEKEKVESNILHFHSEKTYSKYELLHIFMEVFGKEKGILKKENGLRYYTLQSIYTQGRKDIRDQLKELKEIAEKFYAI